MKEGREGEEDEQIIRSEEMMEGKKWGERKGDQGIEG